MATSSTVTGLEIGLVYGSMSSNVALPAGVTGTLTVVAGKKTILNAGAFTLLAPLTLKTFALTDTWDPGSDDTAGKLTATLTISGPDPGPGNTLSMNDVVISIYTKRQHIA